jgi:hypothetical protein
MFSSSGEREDNYSVGSLRKAYLQSLENQCKPKSKSQSYIRLYNDKDTAADDTEYETAVNSVVEQMNELHN